MFANKFALQRLLAGGDVRARNEDENFQVLEAADLVVSAGNLVFSLGGGERFGPQGVIICIHSRLQEAIGGSRKDLRDGVKVSRGDIDRQKIVGITIRHKLGQKGKHIATVLVMRRRRDGGRRRIRIGRRRIRNGSSYPGIQQKAVQGRSAGIGETQTSGTTESHIRGGRRSQLGGIYHRRK